VSAAGESEERNLPGRANESGSKPAVFLDRDGTISEEVGYVNHLSRLRLFPWTVAAILKLNRAGLPVIVVTNQSGVGQGYFPEALVHEAHQQIQAELNARGAHVDAFYYCPHHPSARLSAYRVECRCRKPDTGMLEQAAHDWHLDLSRSFIVGDSTRDVECGTRAGASTIMVMTGYGRGNFEYQRHLLTRAPDWTSENLQDAVDTILLQLSQPIPASVK
jgi:D-glycero-D-manno-heptose 1,7-bisphosphate phosphatase